MTLPAERINRLSTAVLVVALASLVCAGAAALAAAPRSSGCSTRRGACPAVLLGDRKIESSPDQLPAGGAEAFPFVASRSGSARFLRAYVDRGNAASVESVALYSSTGNHPGSLLTSGSVVRPARGAWNTAAIRSTRLQAGKLYWLAVMAKGGTLRFRDRPGGSCSSITSAGRRLKALPKLWRGSKQWSTCAISAYATGIALRGRRRHHSSPPPSPPTPPGLAFDDEFNGTSVNGSLWSVMNQHGDQSNSEPECYLTSNTTEGGGVLAETAHGQTASCPDGTGTTGYTSGAVQMKSFNFTYGTVDVRAKMAGGTGTWPAIWLLGADCQHPTWLSSNCPWPNPGSDEIDISEIIGGDLKTVRQTLISGDVRQTCSPSTSDVSRSWHAYTLDWAPGQLTFKIDGATTCTVNGSGVPSHPMFLIIDTAVGGNGGGSIDNSTLPQTTSVDYVRISKG